MTVTAAVAGLLILLFWVLPWLIDSASQLPDHTGETREYASSHAAPRRPYPVDEAHWVTQDHIDCDARTCAAKAAAIDVLIEAGHMKPARYFR
ncbi:hypothetical protein OHA40_11140 [Nocardia sp. NBC_00508]|uniref:hypothetical protein n=1 Tax=Nocardia sp. NBC_00508 TaxID=2975992 RepID=UPI002E7FC56A|nr:hypothetical protein [Nocardia sp. NBC_00508]WUD68612.1 hypothetical protein OHA40_11140 [Nocardia sp. NBC_00508]